MNKWEKIWVFFMGKSNEPIIPIPILFVGIFLSILFSIIFDMYSGMYISIITLVLFFIGVIINVYRYKKNN